MLLFDAEHTRARAPIPCLIECLRDAFRGVGAVPPRQLHKVPGGAGDRLFLIMPGFDVEAQPQSSRSACFPTIVRVGWRPYRVCSWSFLIGAHQS
jgi:hypothetical protein